MKINHTKQRVQDPSIYYEASLPPTNFIIAVYMFRPIRERCPFANMNVMFAKILSRSRKFCSARELDPIGKLASEHEFEMQLINLKLEAHTHSMTISSQDT